MHCEINKLVDFVRRRSQLHVIDLSLDFLLYWTLASVYKCTSEYVLD